MKLRPLLARKVISTKHAYFKYANYKYANSIGVHNKVFLQFSQPAVNKPDCLTDTSCPTSSPADNLKPRGAC